ncbi:MAG: hypothetical protein ACTHOL_12490, partial [Luteibacter jiangsuensis]
EWENVVSACLACNLKKATRTPQQAHMPLLAVPYRPSWVEHLILANRTPQQAHMPLLAVPYRPSWVEHLILSNRNILADQMEFLVNHLPRDRRRAMG